MRKLAPNGASFPKVIETGVKNVATNQEVEALVHAYTREAPNLYPGSAAGAQKVAITNLRHWVEDKAIDGTHQRWRTAINDAERRLSGLTTDKEPLLMAGLSEAAGPGDPHIYGVENLTGEGAIKTLAEAFLKKAPELSGNMTAAEIRDRQASHLLAMFNRDRMAPGSRDIWDRVLTNMGLLRRPVLP
jgi:hypothetical protein